MASIVAIGNPGSGKSTILNALAGKTLFHSGISFGSGLTSKLNVGENDEMRFMDTPGVADDTYRNEAGEALTEVFNKGGRMKILFFVTQQSGRVVTQDVATMKLILEAVPEIGHNYGIIVNKVPDNVLKKLINKEHSNSFIAGLFYGIREEFKHNQIIMLRANESLDSIDDALIDVSEIHPSLLEFVKFSVPHANITPDVVQTIPVDEFDRINKEMEDLESKIQSNQDFQQREQEKLASQLEAVEEAKKKQIEEDQKRYEEELNELQKNMAEAEEKKASALHDAEIEALNQQINGMKAMHAQQTQHMNEQMTFFANQRAMQEQEAAAASGNPLNQLLGCVAKLGTTALAAKFMGPAAAGAALMQQGGNENDPLGSVLQMGTDAITHKLTTPKMPQTANTNASPLP